MNFLFLFLPVTLVAAEYFVSKSRKPAPEVRACAECL